MDETLDNNPIEAGAARDEMHLYRAAKVGYGQQGTIYIGLLNGEAKTTKSMAELDMIITINMILMAVLLN